MVPVLVPMNTRSALCGSSPKLRTSPPSGPSTVHCPAQATGNAAITTNTISSLRPKLPQFIDNSAPAQVCECEAQSDSPPIAQASYVRESKNRPVEFWTRPALMLLLTGPLVWLPASSVPRGGREQPS